MIKSDAAYSNYRDGRELKGREDRLPPGPALLVVFGLSIAGWAFVLAPLVAILNQ